MNVDRTLDYSGKRWRGTVVNVMDPKKQGRIQVRVVGMHDNTELVPDKDLPWALVRIPMGAGASVRGVSSSPVGVIPGTVVDGYFADSDRTTFVATGTLVSAGRTKKGQTVDGSYAIDSDYNDIANSARGQDLNAALGLRNLPALSQVGAIFPVVSAGLGALTTHTGNLLNLMSEIDPLNMSGTMAQAIEGFSSSYMLNTLTDAASSFAGGLTGLLGALGTAQTLISQGVAEAQALAALPATIQELAKTPAGIGQLISMASSVTGVDPVGLLSGTAVGGIMNQALGLAGVVGGGFSSIVNQVAANFAVTNKLRDYALKAASPEPPPVPDPPTSTSSKAATTPSKNKDLTDPYQDVAEIKLPPPVMSASDLDTNAAPQTITAAQEQFIEANVPVNTAEENLAILNQLEQREAQDQQQQQSIQTALQFGMGA